MLRLIIFFSIFTNIALADEILHVSFDTTRELFKELNQQFIIEQKKLGFKNIKILQSHGGSGKQTSAIIHGLKADIVTLALPYHMDILKNHKLVSDDWRSKFSYESSPFFSYIVFLVRKNNPKKIYDWSDLIRSDVKIISANPKTSGGAMWNYLAAWIYAEKTFNNNFNKTQEFISKLYHNAPILDSSTRTSSVTFLKRGIGDVLITWNNEAEYIINHLNPNYKIIEPSLSVKINIPIAITKNCKNKILAQKYIDFIYSPEGQKIIQKFYFQSYNQDEKLKNKLYVIEDSFDWVNFKECHFGNNGIFDRIYN